MQDTSWFEILIRNPLIATPTSSAPTPPVCLQGEFWSVLSYELTAITISNVFDYHLTAVCVDSTYNTVNSPLTDTLVSRQLYFNTDAFLDCRFYLPETLYLRFPISRRGHFWKWNLYLFHCSRSLLGRHTTYCINWLLWQSNRSVGIGFLKLPSCLAWHQERVSVAIFGYPTET